MTAQRVEQYSPMKAYTATTAAYVIIFITPEFYLTLRRIKSQVIKRSFCPYNKSFYLASIGHTANRA